MPRWREDTINTAVDPPMNGTRPHGLPTPQDESQTTGFTAVNGDVRRTASQSSADVGASSSRPLDEDTIPVAAIPRPETLREIRSKDAEAQSEKRVESSHSHRHNSAGTKRKRSDSQDHASIRDPMRLDTINTGANGSQSPKRRHIQAVADSAIDLTSPSNDPPNPLRRDFVSELTSLTPQAKGPSPVPRRTPLEKPPRPTAETEAILTESLRKFQQNQQSQQAAENRQSQSQSGSIGRAGSPEDEQDDLDGPDEGEGGQHGESSDSKKRKRNFSNRTKTGCHTCRGRKKKCDEAKPRCKNCERGGFECLGYGPKQPGQKVHLQGRGVVPLQAKGNEAPPGPAMLYPTQPPPPLHHPDDNRHYRNWSLSHAEQDHARRPYEAPPSQRRGSQGGVNEWHRPQWSPYGQPVPLNQPPVPPPPPPPPFSPDHIPQPSHSQHAPYGHHQPPPPPPPPFPSMASHYPHPEHQPAVPVQPPVPDRDPWNPMRHHYPPGPPMVGSSRESVANRSSHSNLPFPALPDNHSTEREKMLAGKPHKHYTDDYLIKDRGTCRKAVTRYNSTVYDKYNSHELRKFFSQILRPKERLPEDKYSGAQYYIPESLKGSIDLDTIVEAPFMCDFGYGLHFGRGTNVGRECYFQDAGGIRIGSQVTIQAKVQLITLTVPVDPKDRGGSYGLYKAGMISIEDNAFIGHGSTIYPYVTVGKNAYVWPGSVVTKDVKEGWEVAGNPAQRVHFSDDLQGQEEKTVKRMEELEEKRKKERDEPK